MIVAVASGKGGTGKTTVATNLACLAAQSGYRVTYVDCDVEELSSVALIVVSARRFAASVP